MTLSVASFVVIATNKYDTTKHRVWVFPDDVSAADFCVEMIKKFSDKEYFLVKRASITEY